MRFLVFSVALFTGVLALPLEKENLVQRFINTDVPTRNSAIEQLLLDALEDLRQTMLTGSDTIPVLDPLGFTSLAINGDDLDLPGSEITLRDLRVDNLSTFDVTSLSVTLSGLFVQRLTIQLDGHIPSLDIYAGDYDLSLSALGFNVFGKGEASIKVIQPRLTGTVVATLSVFGFNLALESVDLKFDLSAFEPEIKGLFGDEGASSFANAFLRNLVPEIVTLYETEISGFLNDIVLEVGNEILENVDIGSILNP